MLKLRVFLFTFVFSTFTMFMPSRAMELNKDAFEKAKIQTDFEVAFTKMIDEYNSDIELRYWNVCKDLLRKGANPKCELACNDWTPLAYACKTDDVEIVRFLLQYPAIDVNFAGDGFGFGSPLEIACRNGNDEIVKLLLEAGANTRGDVFADLFLSVCDCAGTNKRHEIVGLLLKYGANPNMATPWGETALMSAKSFEDIQVLIEYGADVKHKCNDGRSVLEYWLTDNTFQKDEDVNKCVSLLVKGGCKINSQCTKGYTALHRVMQDSNIKLAKMPYVVSALFNHGANPMIKDKKGRTAFDCAYNDSVKDILKKVSCLHSPAVKEGVLLLLGAKHVNSRGIDEFDGEK